MVIFNFTKITSGVTVRHLGVGCLWGQGLTAAAMMKGLVLGIYSKDKEDGVPQFTSAGEDFDKSVAGKLREILNISGPPLKAGKTRVFYGLHQDFPSLVVVGLGKRTAGVDDQQNWHEDKENIRTAIAAGCRQVQDLELLSVKWIPVEILRLPQKELCLGSMNMMT
jgi:aminopeptidase